MASELPSGASSPAPIAEDEPSTTPPEFPLAKGKNRQRLLRGIQRISSSPSLASARRARSHSAPYRSSTRSTLSCVSLADPGPSPTHQNIGPAAPLTPPVAVGSTCSSRPETPATEFPFFDNIESQLAIREADAGRALSSGISPLPADVKLTRPDGLPRSRTASGAKKLPPFKFWDKAPYEIQIHIFSFLKPKQLVQASRVSRHFHHACFDGQLWTSLDASEFYQEIPAESLSRIALAAGPFIKDLNLRGCVQVEHYKRAESIVKACSNLRNATLEGCRNFQKATLHTLVHSNEALVHLNLTGLTAVSSKTCKLIAESCPRLEALNVSWCGKVDSRGIEAVINGCPNLKDLRAREVRGFDSTSLAQAIFETNKLERLLLSGCAELSDEALQIMMHGRDPEIDILTDRPVVPPRRLRHLDLSRCARLSDDGVRAIGHLTPDLEGLQLSRCRGLSDAALEPILASTPKLTHLELEDLDQLTNDLLSEHLAEAPCAPKLEHLSLSYCEHLGDVGMLSVMQKCVGLRSVDLDNTRISDLTLAEAATMVVQRSAKSTESGVPRITLRMAVYDCPHVTWTGIREVLYRNAQVRPAPDQPGKLWYPTETITLKCFYGFQMTVDEHQKRVCKGDFDAAHRLEMKWADYMQASEEAGAGGSGYRRRRRRARAAEAVHLSEEDGLGRRRARTMGSCFVM